MRWTARSPVPPWCEKQSGRTAGPSPLLIVAQTHVTEAGSCRTPSETRKERTKVNYLCPACAAPRLSESGVCVDGGSSPSSRRRDVFAYRPPPQRTFTHQRRPTFFVLVYRPTQRTTLLFEHHTTFRWHTHMMAANVNSREWEADLPWRRYIRSAPPQINGENNPRSLRAGRESHDWTHRALQGHDGSRWR